MRRFLALLLVSTLAACGAGTEAGGGSADASSRPAARQQAAVYGSTAYIGCSNTMKTVEQVNVQRPLLMWKAYNTGGQDLVRWGTPGSFAWSRYDQADGPAATPTRVWVQFCAGAAQTMTTAEQNDLGRTALAELRERVGTVPVYVSAVEVVPGGTCPKGDAARMEDLADQMVSEGLALRGPTLSPLLAGDLADGCHPTTAAAGVRAGELADFLDTH